MKVFSAIFITLGYISLGDAFSKYGRTCKDIGCSTNEQCVMESDPCSYRSRENECGAYPTCKRISGSHATCSTYICPPTKPCKMFGNTPKCVDDPIQKGHVGYDTSSLDGQVQPAPNNNQPSAPLYPSIPRGETTPRPNIRPQVQGGGYQGGQIGSGYPGQPSRGGYPQQSGGYPQQPGGYPQQPGGYPQQAGGYPQGSYSNPGGYPQGGYPQGGYPGYNQGGQQPGQYPGYNQGYNPYQQNPYGNRNPQKSSGSSLTDKLSETLKSVGLFCCLLKYLTTRILQL